MIIKITESEWKEIKEFILDTKDKELIQGINNIFSQERKTHTHGKFDNDKREVIINVDKAYAIKIIKTTRKSTKKLLSLKRDHNLNLFNIGKIADELSDIGRTFKEVIKQNYYK